VRLLAKWFARVAFHELGHGWFGNCVTMQGWNNLWFNEGFATFLECAAVDCFFPAFPLALQKYIRVHAY
jgi:aminopeptidase N